MLGIARHQEAKMLSSLPAADRLVGSRNQLCLTADLHLKRTEWAGMEKRNLFLVWWETQKQNLKKTYHRNKKITMEMTTIQRIE